MPKLGQRGVIHLLLPLLLIGGIIVTVWLVTNGNPLKLFSKAGGGPIWFTDVNGVALPLNSAGIPQSTSPSVKVQLYSTLGPPASVSGPTSSGTVAYRTGFDPTQLDSATYGPYLTHPTVYTVGFPNTPGIYFYWVDFKGSNGTVDRRSAQLEIVSPSTSGPVSPTPTPTPTATPPGGGTGSSSRVFITSTRYNGNLGGAVGADAKCQERANAANLGGTWKAWLSSSTTSASSRLNHYTTPYKLLNGTVIASNWTDLTDGTIQNTITINEYSQPASGTPWSNTDQSGELISKNSITVCGDWTSAPGTSYTYRLIGRSDKTDKDWTDWNTGTYCNMSQTLYCFEQPASGGPTSKPTPTSTPTPKPTPKPLPDLTITSITPVGTSIKAGTWNYYRVVVKNQGTASVSSNTLSNIYMSITSPKPGGKNTSCQTGLSTAIPAGQATTFELYCIAYDAGYNTFTAKVDNNNQITESNENNNTKTVKLYVRP